MAVDRTEALYLMGEIIRIKPNWIENEPILKKRVDRLKKEMKELKTQLADAQTKWAESRDYIAYLDETYAKLTEALDDLVDEPEAVSILKAHQGAFDRESQCYKIETKEQFEAIRKALYTVGVAFRYSEAQLFMEITKYPDSYKEFIFGVEETEKESK